MEDLKEKLNILNRLNGLTFYGTLAFISLVILLIEFIGSLINSNISLFKAYFLIEVFMFIFLALTTVYHWYVKEETKISFELEPIKKEIVITKVEEIEETVNEYEKELTTEELEDLKELEVIIGHNKRVVVKEIVKNPLTDEELEELARLEKEMGGK